MINPLVTLAINEAPAIISAIKGLFTQRHPGQPEPTSEEVIAALQSALESSLAKDAAWLAAHGSQG